ncbi:putative HD superfamily hydrolase of NAD metabolism [Pilibacter termitis]|uniref:bis(5'-nucleosyl)-tetraphosphatase (symmetrical) n=1 Tax=Pilibacter termitis TaxID=263852 RepID=A0A1T4KUV5_9ENTE|nr:bis(5'-nucleosyl)-tetraphosphatase (symmetrical) YqeK [Pilibacter termitis]SJZ46176.1 putative HD superfamily hydrolase of NAD metabolism [Pilibacter termitis]
MEKKNLMYSGKYFQGTREELLKRVNSVMSEKRFRHVLGVEKAAFHLAEKYGEELEKTSIAALVHDYAKEKSDDEMIALIRESAIDNKILPFGNNIWHGIAGVEVITRELAIDNEEILQAVRVHTTASSQMSLLDKIIFVADYIEENRTFPLVEEARKIAEENLDFAVKFELIHTLEHLIAQNAKIYPQTIEAYNTWVAGMK